VKLSDSHLTVAGVRIPLLLLGGIAVAAVLLGQHGSGLMSGPLPSSGTPAGSFVPIYDGVNGFPTPDPRSGFLQGSSP
jgi:hypothetical protein